MTQGARPLEAILADRHLPALDGLRAVAVFLVIGYHFGFSSIPGDLGVSVFFVLSGFLITWLLLKERATSERVSLRAFYARRTLRIFPAYYVFLLVSFAQEHVRGYSWSMGLLLSGLSYTVNYYNAFQGHPGTAIAHAWSLGVEEQFYLLWPCLFVLLARSGPSTMTGALAGLVAAVVAWRSFLALGVGVSSAYLYNALDTRLDNLLLGCLLAVCLQQRWLRHAVASLGHWKLAPFVTLGLLLTSRMGGPRGYHYSIGFTVDAALISIFIVQVIQANRAWPWSWLDHPLAGYLGRISYSLYLYHQLGLGLGRRATMLPLFGQFLAGIAFTLLLAAVSYHFIERPFLAIKNRFPPGRTREDRVAPGAVPTSAGGA